MMLFGSAPGIGTMAMASCCCGSNWPPAGSSCSIWYLPKISSSTLRVSSVPSRAGFNASLSCGSVARPRSRLSATARISAENFSSANLWALATSRSRRRRMFWISAWARRSASASAFSVCASLSRSTASSVSASSSGACSVEASTASATFSSGVRPFSPAACFSCSLIYLTPHCTGTVEPAFQESRQQYGNRAEGFKGKRRLCLPDWAATPGQTPVPGSHHHSRTLDFAFCAAPCSAVHGGLPVFVRFLLPCLAVLSLAACGGDSGSDTVVGPSWGPLTSGVLEGPVTGLRYETGSESGITDESGTFSYRVGQRVHFYIG